MAVQELLIGPSSPLHTAQQTTPDKVSCGSEIGSKTGSDHTALKVLHFAGIQGRKMNVLKSLCVCLLMCECMFVEVLYKASSGFHV